MVSSKYLKLSMSFLAGSLISNAAFAADTPIDNTIVMPVEPTQPQIQSPPPVIPQDIPMSPDEEYGSNFYFRLDSGYSWFSEPTMTEGRAVIDNAVIDTGYFVGGGVGYAVNDSFRLDLTAEYAVMDGLAADNFPKADLSSITVLANAYVDFGQNSNLTFDGLITPYLGLGIGYGMTSIGEYQYTSLRGASVTGEEKIGGLAGAAMAGATVAFTESLALDIGYRFMYYGEADFGANEERTIEDIMAHQVRGGIRFYF